LKSLSKRGNIALTAHKRALTKEVVKKLYDEGELVEFGTLNPRKLQTAWFFISLFLGKRGRENQQTGMKKTMFALRKHLLAKTTMK